MDLTYFWCPVGGSNPYIMLISARDHEAAREVGLKQSLAIEEPVRADEHQTCQGCTIRDACFESMWDGAYTIHDPPPNEAGQTRPHHQPLPDGQVRTHVHICPVCLTTRMSSWPQTTESLDAPPGCPRRDPNKDTVVCNGCAAHREQLYREHPRYETLMAATEQYMEAHEKKKLEVEPVMPKGVINFGKKHKQVEAERALARASQPFSFITKAEEFDRPRGVLAMWMLHDYWQVLPDDLHAYMAGYPDEVAEAKREWLEELYLALGRHLKLPDPECAKAVTREWVLGFTDQNILSFGWMAMPIADRKMLLRRWETSTEHRLAAELFEMDPEITERLFNQP